MNKPIEYLRTLSSFLIGTCLVVFGGVYAHAHDRHASATYLANEAILVTNGDIKIMFDPLFGEGFGTYPLVPAIMQTKIMAGEAPFDGIDGVFVSHVHGDHFAANDMVDYLTAHKNVRLFAPAQAIERMKSLNPVDMTIFDRAVIFKMETGGTPISFAGETLSVGAIRIPHSGNRPHIENMVFRVTLGAENEGSITVMHMGDADVDDRHFAPYGQFWQKLQTDHAFPPYWFVNSSQGRKILNTRINAKAFTGTHVPIKIPFNLQLGGHDYFSKSGESRNIPVPHKEHNHE